MRLDTGLSRGTLIVLGVALAAASLTSPAGADPGRRYKGARMQRGPVVVRHAYYSSRGSSAGPAIAGFIGGLIIGNVLAQAAPPPTYCAPVRDYGYRDPYSYYDPYCRETFVSLEAYGAHLDCVRHPAFVRVIEVDNGRCVGERAWRDGRWRDSYGSRGRYDSRGSDDPYGDRND
jgi:hypothetical protein